MNEKHPAGDKSHLTDAENSLERLFKQGEPRQRPPADVEKEIRDAVHAEWRAVTGRRVWASRAWMAAAASIFIVISIAVLTNRPVDQTSGLPAVATLQRVIGNFEVGPERTVLTLSSLTDGAGVAAGDIVATLNGQASFELPNGGSLRLPSNTRVAFISSLEIELLDGTIYFDSQQQASERTLTVHTGIGTLYDIGTQFLAQLDGESLLVSVREGAVSVNRENLQAEAQVGERVSVGLTGILARDSIPLFGDQWSWVEQLAPPFAIEGKSLSDFLAWFEGETGRLIVFDLPSTAEFANDTTLHGRVDLEPMQMLQALLATTDFNFEIRAQEIFLSRR